MLLKGYFKWDISKEIDINIGESATVSDLRCAVSVVLVCNLHNLELYSSRCKACYNLYQ